MKKTFLTFGLIAGLIITLVSAAILRRNAPVESASAPAVVTT